MPELPEVETVRRGLAPIMVGAMIVAVDQRRADLRFPFPDRFASRLSGRRVVSLERRAKYLRAWLDDGVVLVMHLGMSGSFRIEAARSASEAARSASEAARSASEAARSASEAARSASKTPAPVGDAFTPGVFHHPRSTLGAHDHVVLTLSTGARVLYNDPRRFGFMLLIAGDALATHPLFRHLGIEPLGPLLDGATLAKVFAGRATPLKTALLDQRMVAGLGNIYVCEALHRAGLSPRRAAGTLVKRDGTATRRAARLAETIREVLLEAVAAGGSSLRDHRLTDGTMGYFQHSFRVYDQEGNPCPKLTCSGTVVRIVQAGRSTFFCPSCQR